MGWECCVDSFLDGFLHCPSDGKTLPKTPLIGKFLVKLQFYFSSDYFFPIPFILDVLKPLVSLDDVIHREI